MSKIEYGGTLVCSINVPSIPSEDGVRLANFFDPDGNPLTLAEPNQLAQASK